MFGHSADRLFKMKISVNIHCFVFVFHYLSFVIHPMFYTSRYKYVKLKKSNHLKICTCNVNYQKRHLYMCN